MTHDRVSQGCGGVIPHETIPSVAVVMLHWGPAQMTREALEAVCATRYPRLTVYLVDQGAQLEGSSHRCEEVIPLPTNIGFCAGNNHAIDRALAESFDYVLLLNNDTLIVPDAIERLVTELERNRAAAAAGPTVLYEDPPDTIWYGGGRYTEKQAEFSHLRHGEYFDRRAVKGTESTTFVPACALLLRTEAVRTIGLLDERYFMYWEDADWCVRARVAGHDLLYVPSAVVIHRLGKTRETNSPRRLYYFFRNWLLFIRLHTPRGNRPRAWLAVANRFLRESIKVVTRYRVTRIEYARMLGRALFDNALRNYGGLDR